MLEEKMESYEIPDFGTSPESRRGYSASPGSYGFSPLYETNQIRYVARG